MGPAFRSADLVLARAGASMLGECPAFGLPSILVPYPYAWRYQKVNADYLVKNGAAIRVKDEDLTTSLVETIASLISDDALLNDMAQAAKAMDTPESTTKLAQLLIDIGQGKVK
jgi:UDP-N-acetylglucosamine--N-acetylmuramyl-(pentapeptide) pyrophosphoryl-undecaprenol N-acetylglucosamine transferase